MNKKRNKYTITRSKLISDFFFVKIPIDLYGDNSFFLENNCRLRKIDLYEYYTTINYINQYILSIDILFPTEISTPMDTTILSDREIDMLVRVIYKNGCSKIKLLLVGAILTIPLEMVTLSYFISKLDIKSIFYLYNTSGRFSRTFLGDSFAMVCHDAIEMVHGILRNG